MIAFSAYTSSRLRARLDTYPDPSEGVVPRPPNVERRGERTGERTGERRVPFASFPA